MIVYATVDISNQSVNHLAKISTFGHILNVVLPTLIIGAAFLLLILLLWGSFNYIMAGGSSENVAKAQKTITYAIGGLIFVILSFIAVKMITIIFNITSPI